MPRYDTLIAQAITAAGYPDHGDPATLALIEDCLRTNRTGLDHLTAEDFAVEVATLIADLVNHPDETRHLCELLGFATPAWLSGPPRSASVLPWLSTCHKITAVLATAFPTTRFILTQARGMGRGHALLRWNDGPSRSSVDDVLAQFLPGHTPATIPHYGVIDILTCRMTSNQVRAGS